MNGEAVNATLRSSTDDGLEIEFWLRSPEGSESRDFVEAIGADFVSDESLALRHGNTTIEVAKGSTIKVKGNPDVVMNRNVNNHSVDFVGIDIPHLRQFLDMSSEARDDYFAGVSDAKKTGLKAIFLSQFQTLFTESHPATPDKLVVLQDVFGKVGLRIAFLLE